MQEETETLKSHNHSLMPPMERPQENPGLLEAGAS